MCKTFVAYLITIMMQNETSTSVVGIFIIKKKFAGMGGDGRETMGMGRDRNHICGDGCNFCSHTGLCV